MSDKKQIPDKRSSEKKKNYELKSEAVDRLVNADKKTYTSLDDPGKKYRSSFLDKIPAWVKAVFMKFWFNGAVCYFIYWGLGIYVSNLENMLIILALVLGMVTDLLVNNAFRFFAATDGENDKWMMFPKKKLLNLFWNVLYAFAVLIIVVWFYNTANGVINVIKGTEGQIFLGVEPILFGLFYVAFDLCFIGMKNLTVSMVRDAKKKNGV